MRSATVASRGVAERYFCASVWDRRVYGPEVSYVSVPKACKVALRSLHLLLAHGREPFLGDAETLSRLVVSYQMEVMAGVIPYLSLGKGQ